MLVFLLFGIILTGQPWPCPDHGHFDSGKNNCVCDAGFNWDGQHCIQSISVSKIQFANSWETCDGNCANPDDVCCVAGDGDKRTCRPRGQGMKICDY